MKKSRLGIFIFLFLAMAGCTPSEPMDQLEYHATELLISATNYAFDQDIYTVPAGTVMVKFENKEGYHGVHVVGTEINIFGNGTQVVDLKRGEYKVICSVPCGPGHADMVATLVVE